MEPYKAFAIKYGTELWTFITTNPLGALKWAVLIAIGYELFFFLFDITNQLLDSRDRVYLRITMPKSDSSKDKEKETEKDFREKISIMAQLYRNLHETKELNMWNTIKVRIFKSNYFSFEIVAQKKIVDFYIATSRYYQPIIEKQITSYYTDAEVEVMPKYEHLLKGQKMKGFYAYTKNKYWFP